MALPDQDTTALRCAVCNGPVYYPKDDARAYCHRVRMPVAVVRIALDEEEVVCDFCGQTDGHSKRCSVTKFGVNPKPPYTDASPRKDPDSVG